MSCSLPMELIISILYRLRVKSLICFKSVSKRWKSLVEDPDFVESYMDQQKVKTKQLILQCDLTSRFLAMDLDSLDKSRIVNLPKLRRSYRRIDLIGSYNGLVSLCCTFSNLDDAIVVDFIIWNMATGEHLIIPLELPHPPEYTFLAQGFGYDGVRDDYKVIRAFKPGRDGGADLVTMVYSLKKHEWVWSIIKSPGYHFDDRSAAGSLVNGALHWCAFENYALDRIIVSFDLNTEEYHKVPLPMMAHDPLPRMEDELESLELAVLGDSLCILVFHDYDVGDIDIWVMKEYMHFWKVEIVFEEVSNSHGPRYTYDEEISKDRDASTMVSPYHPTHVH
ncbi:F-box protein CPR30-like [Tripterygium wilfordii]|uniref:F-box protein CPR30-like n=1 Tax=Tripterygium wilfordii TaxID=458696 RepID=A0A7J7D2F6_TRIWF|nr:F-box protein CPR30-like [Tripterygium wilfordii]